MSFLPVKNPLHSIGFMHMQGPNGDGRRNPCADFELNAAECMEAYGLRNGSQLCAAFIEDLFECKTNLTSHMRMNLMRLEVMKKVANGENKFSEIQGGEKAPTDSFFAGCMYP